MENPDAWNDAQRAINEGIKEHEETMRLKIGWPSIVMIIYNKLRDKGFLKETKTAEQVVRSESAIAAIKECIRIHQYFIDHLKSNREWAQELIVREKAVGDAKWHEDWIRKYEQVLQELESQAD